MKYLLVPEDHPSGDPDFPRELARYSKAPLHYARLVPSDSDFGQKCRNVVVERAFWGDEPISDLIEMETKDE